jgi:hypothetical protein
MSLLTRLTLTAAAAAILPAAAQAQQPQPAPAKDSTAPAVAAAPVDTMKTVDEPLVLAGFYEMNAGRGLTITFEDDALFGTPPNGEKRKLIHKYGTTYSPEGTQMTLTFKLDANGLPTELVMRVNGQERVLKKGN